MEELAVQKQAWQSNGSSLMIINFAKDNINYFTQEHVWP